MNDSSQPDIGLKVTLLKQVLLLAQKVMVFLTSYSAITTAHTAGMIIWLSLISTLLELKTT